MDATSERTSDIPWSLGGWRREVLSRLEELLFEWTRLRQMYAGDDNFDRIRHSIEEVHGLAMAKHSMRTQLSGHDMEDAQRRVRLLESRIKEFAPDGELAEKALELCVIAQNYLPSTDKRLIDLNRKVASGSVKAVDRPLIRSLRRAVMSATDQQAKQIRNLRNVLLLSTFLLALLAGIVLFVGTAYPGAISICVDFIEVGGSRTVCPSGWGPQFGPTRGEIALAALFGLIGAALAGARTLSAAQHLQNPDSLLTVQVLLKVPLGMITAVVGLVIVASGKVPGVGVLEDSSDLLFLAVVFGYAQQTLTGIIDRRANELNRVRA